MAVPRHFAGWTRIFNNTSKEYYYEPNNATKNSTWNAPEPFLEAIYESPDLYKGFPEETVHILQKINKDSTEIVNTIINTLEEQKQALNVYRNNAPDEEKQKLDEKILEYTNKLTEYENKFEALKELRKQLVLDAMAAADKVANKGGRRKTIRRRKTRKARKLSKKLKS
jgi:hypothetical protein